MNNVYVKTFQRVWNNGLGFLPVSTFIEIDKSGTETPIQKIYDDILQLPFNNPDIMFKIMLKEDFGGLSWLIPKLIMDGYVVTVISNIDNFQDMYSSRFVVCTCWDICKSKLQNKLAYLSDTDSIVFQEESIGKLKYSLNAMRNNGIKAKLLFDTEVLSKEEVLSEGIIDCMPTNTKFIDEE